MSVRPQPVTATIRSVDYYAGLVPGLRPSPALVDCLGSCDLMDCYSDSDSGSTDSLTSILHHDSYESADDWSEEEERNAIGYGRGRGGTPRSVSPVGHDTRVSSYRRCQPTGVTKETLILTAPRGPRASKPTASNSKHSTGQLKRVTSSALSQHSQSAAEKRGSRPRNPLLQPNASTSHRQIKSQKENVPKQRPAKVAASTTPRTNGSQTAKQRNSMSQDIDSKIASTDRPLQERSSSLSNTSASESTNNRSMEGGERNSGRDKERSPRRSASVNSTLSTSATSSRSTRSEQERGEVTVTECDRELTPWEEWLLEKEKKNRLNQKRKSAAEKRERVKKTAEDEAKAAKAKVCEERVQQWWENKKKSNLETSRKQKIKQRIDKEEEESKKETQKQKAERKFAEWQEQKRAKESRARSEDRVRQEAEKQEAAKKREKADEAFDRWKEVAASRPVTAPYSYGYADGKLTGYYDKTSNPTPSFINPRAWVPPEIHRRVSLMLGARKSGSKGRRRRATVSPHRRQRVY